MQTLSLLCDLGFAVALAAYPEGTVLQQSSRINTASWLCLWLGAYPACLHAH